MDKEKNNILFKREKFDIFAQLGMDDAIVARQRAENGTHLIR